VGILGTRTPTKPKAWKLEHFKHRSSLLAIADKQSIFHAERRLNIINICAAGF
jgi:hypothetical protein